MIFCFLFLERANVSLHELDDLLQGTSPSATSQSKAKHQLESVLHPRTLRWYEDSNRPSKYKDAASQLNQILGHEPQVTEQMIILFLKLCVVFIPVKIIGKCSAGSYAYDCILEKQIKLVLLYSNRG